MRFILVEHRELLSAFCNRTVTRAKLHCCRPIAGLISRLLPKLQAVKTEKSPLNPEIQAFFDKGEPSCKPNNMAVLTLNGTSSGTKPSSADPQMWHGWTRARNASEYLLATEALCKAMPSVTFPFVCFHGEADTMTDADGSKKLYEEAQVPRPPCSQHHPYACAQAA